MTIKILKAMKEKSKKFVSYIKHKPLKSLCIFLYIFVGASLAGAFLIPSDNKIAGTYVYVDSFNKEEILILRSISSVDYRIVDINGNEHPNTVTQNSVKWRSVYFEEEAEKYANMGYKTSKQQIQICNSSGGSYFQLFKVGKDLYSKVETGEQKCFKKTSNSVFYLGK